MKINWYAGILLAGALALGACGDGGGGNKAGNAAAPAANEAAPAANESGEATGGNEAAAGGEQAAGGAQQDFTIVNNTGQAVMTLNVSPSNENEWGPDILGADVLQNGQSGQIQFARGQEQCNWDVRVTYQDGETGDWRGVNLCETSTITLTAE